MHTSDLLVRGRGCHMMLEQIEQTIGMKLVFYNRQSARARPPLALRYMDALTEAIKRRMLSGSGVAWLPESVVAEELAAGLVTPVGGEAWQATLTLSLFCSHDRLDKIGRQVWDAL